jgi:hypothetical protein
MSRLKNAIKALHARKDRAYGAAWKRRGERISIVPNIARKVDRLTTFAAGGLELLDESILDTAIDLNVYCLKYLLFLVDEDADLLCKLSLSKPAWPLSDREENLDQLVDAAGYEEAESKPLKLLVANISELFERLWPAVEAGGCPEKRFAIADALCTASVRLVARWRLEQAETVEKFIQGEFGLMSRELRS